MATTRNRPISSVEIESELVRIVNDLEAETEAFEELAQDFAKKEAIYKAAWYREYLSADGAIKNKESIAGHKTMSQYYESMVAEAMVKAKREKLHSLRTACDALRTLSANVRSQVKY